MLESKITPSTSGASYTATWNGTLTAIIDVAFAGGYTCKNDDGSTVTANGDDHRRHFFNTGGDIRFSTAGANGSGSKSADLSIVYSAKKIYELIFKLNPKHNGKFLNYEGKEIKW